MFKNTTKVNRKLQLINGGNLGFSIDDGVHSATRDHIIALDKTWNMLALVDEKDNLFFLNGGDVLSIDLLIDKKVTQQKPISELLFRQFIGGLISGEKGETLAGWATKSVQKERIRSLSLKLIIKDINKPSHIIPFWLGGSKNQLKEATELVEHWYGVCSLFI